MKKTFLTLLVFVCSFSAIAQTLFPQQNKKGLWGYVNEKGRYVIKAKYDEADSFQNERARIMINNHYGFINLSGELVIPAIYDSAESFRDNFALCSKDGLYGFLNRQGHELIGFEYDDVSLSETKGFYIGKKNNDNKAYVILTGNDLRVEQYDELLPPLNSHYVPIKLSDKYGFLKENGTVAISPVYLELPEFNQSGVAIVHKETGYGLLSSTINEIVPAKYSYVKERPDHSFIYGNSDTDFGIIDSKGNITLKQGDYTSLTKIENQYLYDAVDQKGLHHLISDNGEILVPDANELSVSDNIVSYRYGDYTRKLDLESGRRALIINDKEIWSADKAQKIIYKKPLLYWTDTKGAAHWMNEKGQSVFESYTDIALIYKDFCRVKKDGKYAVANTAGNVLSEWVDHIYPTGVEDYVWLVKSGWRGSEYAIFRVSTKKMITGYDFSRGDEADKAGLIPATLIKSDNYGQFKKKLKMAGDSFYIAGDVYEGLFTITDFKTKKMGVMDVNGKLIVSPKYDQVGDYMNGMSRVFIVGKGYGFINKSGALVIPCKYAEAYNFGEIEGLKNYTQVWDLYGRSYYINKSGKTVSADTVLKEAYQSQRQNSWY